MAWKRATRKGKRKIPLADVVGEKRLEQSQFCSSLGVEMVGGDVLHRLRQATALVCLGIGSLELSATRHQVAFLTHLQSVMTGLAGPVRIWDPICSDEDVRFFQSMSNVVFGELSDFRVDGDTLFYMPHCPHFLYDKVIKDNHDQLASLIVLGNDFRDYQDRPDLPFVQKAAGKADIKTFSLASFHSNIFSGTAWHLFREPCEQPNSASVDRIALLLARVAVG
ncbi:sensitivity to red-light reduced protein [Kappamyces sp. JEL0680]|nr:sensitivity to red-light reduced protein [Kappamyces sp. JEL0680]